MADAGDFLDELIAERTKDNPDFPKLLEAASQRRLAIRQIKSQYPELAEEVAELEHTLEEQQRQIEIGTQQIVAVLVHLANGDFNVRVQLDEDDMLRQIADSLNGLVPRLARFAQADFILRRTQEEVRRLTEAIYDLSSGRQPIWPEPSNTPVDQLIDPLRRYLKVEAPSSSEQIAQKKDG